MTRREFIGVTATGAAAAATCAATQGNKRPNVLLFFTDDHRQSGVGAYGMSEVKTPTLDQIAVRGVLFGRAYLQGGFSGATCIPSRAQLLTGRSLFSLDGNRPNEGDVLLPETFRNHGYHTFFTGKRHALNGKQLARCFDEGGPVFGFGGYLTDKYRMPIHDWSPEGKYEQRAAYLLGPEGERNPVSKDSPAGPLISQVFCERAAEFVRKYHGDEPWFVYLPIPAPHDPHDAPEEFRKLYDPETLELPPNCLPSHPFDNGDMDVRDEKLAARPRDPAEIRQRTADYYAAITHLDHQFGKVVQALEDTGQLDNTIIVFAGDSGLAIGQHGLLGKQNVYEDSGMRVPLLMSGPGLPAEQRCDALVYTYELFATLCDLTGLPVPSTVQGESVMPTVRGNAGATRERAYLAYLGIQRAVVERRYKLIEYVPRTVGKGDERRTVGTRATQLFDLQNDPWETVDLSAEPEHAATVSRLRADMGKLANEFGDSGHAFWRSYQRH